MKRVKSAVATLLASALVLTAPGLAPYAAAGDVVVGEVRGQGPVVVNAAGGAQVKALPELKITTLSGVSTIKTVAGTEAIVLQPGAAEISRGLDLIRDQNIQVPAGLASEPQAAAQEITQTVKDVAPGLQTIAEPKSSGESSAGAANDLELVLQGRKPSSFYGSVDARTPAAFGGWKQTLGRAGKRVGVTGSSLFGAGLIGAGAFTTGGVAAGLIVIPLMIASFVLHEVAHARVAYMLGDPGPVLANRGSLSPRDWNTHFDWLWTFVLPVASFLTMRTIMGGARPVEFDSERFKKTGPVVGAALAAFAGPAVNLALAGLGALGFAALGTIAASGLWIPVLSAASFATGMFAVTNAVIALYNLVPFYPLDGHFILNALLPAKTAAGLKEFYRTGGLLAWVPFLIFSGILMKFGLAAMAVSWLAHVLLGGAGAATLHLAAAALPAMAGVMVGQIRDTGVPKLKAQPQAAEYRFMKSRLAEVRKRLEDKDVDPEWRESLEQQADGYSARVLELEAK